MAFKVSYAGVLFTVADDEILAWIERNIPLHQMQEVLPPWSPWVGKNTHGLAVPLWPPYPPPRIGEYFYPVGASRWSVYHGIATLSQTKAMQDKVLKASGPVAQPFIMECGVEGNNWDDLDLDLETKLWMLPPRVLTLRNNSDLESEGLYLITLVDDRYYFQFKNASKVQLVELESWSSLIDHVASQLGISLDDYGDLSPDWGKPEKDSDLYGNCEHPAVLLDAAAANVGMMVVRNLDGTFALHDPESAKEQADQNRPSEPRLRLAGGDTFGETDYPGLLLSRQSILPKKVVVTFPKYVTGTTPTAWIDPRKGAAGVTSWIRDSYGDVWTEEVLLGDAGTVLEGNFYTVPDAVRVFRDTAKATYNAATDITPTNQVALQDLAKLIAKHYYEWLDNGLDEVWPGIWPWQPGGAHDILWTARADLACTRVMVRPWNFGVTELQHAFDVTVDEGDDDGALTVKEDDDDPSVGNVSTLRFDHVDFTVVPDGASPPYLDAATIDRRFSGCRLAIVQQSLGGDAILSFSNAAIATVELYDTDGFFNPATPNVIYLSRPGYYSLDVTLVVSQVGTIVGGDRNIMLIASIRADSGFSSNPIGISTLLIRNGMLEAPLWLQLHGVFKTMASPTARDIVLQSHISGTAISLGGTGGTIYSSALSLTWLGPLV